MSDTLIAVKPQIEKKAHFTSAQYRDMYNRSVKDPSGFWGEVAGRLDWYRKPTKIMNASFDGDVSIRWYEDGVLNAAHNCLDRHLKERGDQVALIWEADNPATPSRKITYRELHERVGRVANTLKKLGVKRGDRVTIYMPMIPEAVESMLACARIGAVHSVVFGGFAPDSIAGRMQDCDSRFIITTDEGLRGGKHVPLKKNVDEALTQCPDVQTCLVFKYTGAAVPMKPGRDLWFHEASEGLPAECPAEPMNAEDPFFLLYTSGSTGKPKGALHSTGGYLAFTAFTHEAVFDYQPGEVYWCTADVGWVTGHSYLVYGPLANGATTVVFEGVPNYPDASRFWQVVDKHQVNILYTAPTALRALMAAGDSFVKKASRKSLRILGSVGEPINPEAWLWYYRVVGEERCPIVDTWWQTETGGIMITPLPGAIAQKPGSATLPFFGIEPAIVDADGKILEGECKGNLVLLGSWPGQMRTVYKDHPRFVQTYFSTYKGKYFTGDGCRRDADGYYWITG
ncbi:MAG: acetate--CoA ligase, partial [Bdellovibrionales bacterium]|nr:acetate--CoA ligase [Bdellovibrionales bacterium]